MYEERLGADPITIGAIVVAGVSTLVTAISSASAQAHEESRAKIGRTIQRVSQAAADAQWKQQQVVRMEEQEVVSEKRKGSIGATVLVGVIGALLLSGAQ